MFLTKISVTAPVSGYAAGLGVVDTLARRPLELAQVTILTGDNGSGKSTLVEAIAIAAGLTFAGSAGIAAQDALAQDGPVTLSAAIKQIESGRSRQAAITSRWP